MSSTRALSITLAVVFCLLSGLILISNSTSYSSAQGLPPSTINVDLPITATAAQMRIDRMLLRQSEWLGRQAEQIIGADGDRQTALLLAVQAYRTSPNRESERSLRRVLSHYDLLDMYPSNMSLTRDFKYLYGIDDYGTVSIYERETRRLVQTIDLETNRVRLRLSEDGSLLLVYYYEVGFRGVELWDLVSKTVRTRTQHDIEIALFGFSPNGTYFYTLFSHCQPHLQLYDSATGEIVLSVPCSDEWVEFAPDDSTLYTMKYVTDAECRQQHAIVARELPSGSNERIVTVSPHHSGDSPGWQLTDNGEALAHFDDQNLNLVDVETGERRSWGSINERAFGYDISGNGRFLLTFSRTSTVKLWRMPEGQLIKTFYYTDSMAEWSSGSIASDMSMIRTVPGMVWKFPFVGFGQFPVDLDQLLQVPKVHQDLVQRYIRRGERLFFDTVTNTFFNVGGNRIGAIPEEDYIVLHVRNGRLLVWNLLRNAGTEIPLPVEFNELISAKRAIFTADGYPLLVFRGACRQTSPSEATDLCLNFVGREAQSLYEIPAPSVEFDDLQLSPNNAYAIFFAQNSINNSVEIWHLASAQRSYVLHLPNDVYGLEISPDGHHLYTNGAYGRIVLYALPESLTTTLTDVSTAHPSDNMTTDIRLQTPERSFDTRGSLLYSVSADGRYLATKGSRLGAVDFVLYDVRSGIVVNRGMIERFTYTTSAVGSSLDFIALSPDSNQWAAGGTSMGVDIQFWQYPTGIAPEVEQIPAEDLISTACSRLFRDLTTAERSQYNIVSITPTCPQ
jgi:WD40 repeat protein